MRHAFFAVTAVALASGAACAQTSVTLYGIVDAGLVHESGGPAGSVTNLSSGVASGSRLGFKGREDLGGGLSANFLLENGFNVDNGTLGQGGLLFGRQAFVGLSGGFGALTAGRQYSPYYKVLRDVADPFAAGFSGKAGNIMATNTRIDNSLEYISPSVGGLVADVLYGLGEVAGNSAAKRNLGAALGYVQGPWNVQLAYHQVNNATATDKTRNTLGVIRHDFRVLVASFGYAQNKGTGSADSRDGIIGLTIPFGVHRVLASYIRHDDRSAANKDANQWAAGYVYSLSKRTDLYASYGQISNHNGAAFTVGNSTDTGSGDKAYNVGIRHFF